MSGSRGRWCTRADSLFGVEGIHVSSVVATGTSLHLPHPRHRGVRHRQKFGQDPVSGSVAALASVPFPNRLPRTELGRHVPPGDPAPVPVNDAFDHPGIVPERTTLPPSRRRKQRSNAGLLAVSQNRITRHPSSIPNNQPEV
jgi:hypothetical protein